MRPEPGSAEWIDFISPTIDARPAALLNGRVVEWGELRPLLNEAAGGRVLREVVLDRLVARAVADAGIAITARDVAAERALFNTTLSPDPDTAVRLARELRRRQGLGRQRFARLMKRNASLRALVRDQVQVTDETISRMYEIVHGPKRQARLMVLPTLAWAQRAIDRVRSAGESFGDVAVEVSTDSSAPRGGLLEPISRADASYPRAVRDALWSLKSGEISPPILIGDQYAVLALVRHIEGDGTDPAAVRGELARQARLHQERLLMDRLARRLLGGAAVTILDEAIKESWEAP